MRSWLTHKVVERFVLSLPRRGLNSKECGNSKGNWEPEHPAMSSTLDDWAHEWEAHSPSDQSVGYKLSGKLLHLPVVEFFHSKDLIIC